MHESSARDLASIESNLSELKDRWRSGEVPFHLFLELRSALLEGLSQEELSCFETATSAIRTTASQLGPSGGFGSGLRTEPPSYVSFELAPGSVLLDQWSISQELGRGGFGIVYKAEDLLLGSVLAVKILDPLKVARKDLLARFQREVNVTRNLVHPRIVRIFDYRQDLNQNLALVSMEFLEGHSVRSLNAYKRRVDRRIPTPLVFSIVEQILEALTAAHQQKVIHRDVTPGNIFLVGVNLDELFGNARADPNVKLLDFGIAALAERTELSSQSRALGTAAYVAPEVMDPNSQDRLTAAVDVYSVGAVAYELLTGRLALGNYEKPSILREGIPDSVDDLLCSLLNVDANARPTVTEALERLRALRNPIETEWFRREQVRVVERDIITALGAEDEHLLEGILASLDPDDDFNTISEVIERGKSWIRARNEEREAAEAQRCQEEKRLRMVLTDSLETTRRMGGDDEVLEAIENLTDFLGNLAQDEPQIRSARSELDERARVLQEKRDEQRRIDQENKLRTERVKKASSELREALSIGDTETVETKMKSLITVVGTHREDSVRSLISEAEQALVAWEQDRRIAEAQREWEAEQTQRKNCLKRLRKRLELSIASEDEEKAKDIAHELMTTLGESAESDRTLLEVRLWLAERERVRREADRERQRQQAAEELREERRLEQLQAEELRVRAALARAIQLAIPEEIESRQSELTRILGEEASQDPDVLRSLKWSTKQRSGRKLISISLLCAVLFTGALYFSMKSSIDKALGEFWPRLFLVESEELLNGSRERGILKVRSNVANDVVTIDGESIGSTPLERELPTGHYTVSVTKDGCKGQKLLVTVEAEVRATYRFVVSCP